MARLFQWIRNLAADRRGRQSAWASRRRRLSFERCESRIALSAADGQLREFTVSDRDLMLTNDGGTITLSFAADEFVNWSAVSNQFDGIAVGQLATFAIRTEPLTTLVQGSFGGVTRQVIGDWEFAPADKAAYLAIGGAFDSAFDKFEPATADDYGMSLSGPELSSPSVNSDLSVIPAPMPTPTEKPGNGQENEGGQIALTPFVAPTGLTLSDGYGSSSIARAKHSHEQLREAPAARSGEPGRLEGLRGRAVVYEVAEASHQPSGSEDHPADEHAANNDEAVALASLNVFALEAVERAAQRTAVAAPALSENSFPADSSAHPDGGLVAATAVDLDLQDLFSLNGEAIESPHSTGSAHHRDEAFSDWPSAEGREAEATALLSPHGDRDRRMLGVGLAAALSFVPLRKALRRRGERAAEHQLPWRRRQA
ncbi:hypothetical protein [Lacipirellula limnantheis]|uniref:Uncharacterized protein n=1 Tax=Lacipirellula limnantheis TaxID=2528024 RepID=A0A517U1Z0_9BACT|nr:hypothetical protein [Lacipirellula limnantheis]QDT74623.1 hypothetical protein I41_38200 [Lacipirellula limnantheis]